MELLCDVRIEQESFRDGQMLEENVAKEKCRVPSP